MRRARCQPDLLDWQPPAPVAAFVSGEVQAATFAGRLSRAVGVALRDGPGDRGVVAAEMSHWLGKHVSRHMLDGYASQGREEHVISAERLMALLHATGDRRLLQEFAEPMGWAVIERRYLPLIELAAVREREDELHRTADALRRQARSGGLI